ncbi:MAG: hypothetical protein ACYTAN_01060 [Planctomycetota bacterium]|jgi:hypothetical protein
MEAAADVSTRVILRIAAAVVAFPSTAAAFHIRKAIRGRDVAAAGVSFAVLLAAEVVVMLGLVPPGLLPAAYLAVGAAAVVALVAGLERSFAVLAVAAALKYVISIVLIQVWMRVIQ